MKLNRIELLGRVGKDPLKHTTNSGINYASFSLAVDKKMKGQEKQTLWFYCKAWEKLGDIVLQYLKKGRPVWLDGEVDLYTKESSDGSKYTTMSVMVRNLQMLPDGKIPTDEQMNDLKASPPISTNADFGGTDFNQKPQYASDELPF